MKNTIKSAGLVSLLALTLQNVNAQDIHFTQFTAVPLVINPAFTGNSGGLYRAAAIYRNQWASVTTPYITYGASFDAPIAYDLSVDDALAVGIQVYNDKAGDGNLTNFTGLASIAYHKLLGKGNKMLSVGMQGGYTEKSIDLTKLYFADEFNNGQFLGGTGREWGTLNNRIHYYTVNAGVTWAQQTGYKFGYILGVGANNLNQPGDGFAKQTSQDAGLGMRYTAQAGAIWFLSQRFSLRPAVLFQNQATANEIIAGNEFNLILGDADVRSYVRSVFLGGWYRSGDAIMITAGFEFKGYRLGLSYDYNNSGLQAASNGNGGFEISLRYVKPNPIDFAHKYVYPCSRF